MKLVTFNIRLDCGLDASNNFCYRKSHILKKMGAEHPDIICFQEVLPHVAAWLKENLRDYYIVGCPRGEHFDDEQTCIAYRPDRFELMKMDAYWLSPTPYVPGSRYPEQSPCPRVCTEATFHEFSSGKAFRLINTHLDHAGQKARILGLRQILKKQENEPFFRGCPSILVGDMNAEPDSEEIMFVTETCHWFNLTRDIGGTYHGFGKEKPVHIDYIFTNQQPDRVSAAKWTDCFEGVYLSDHYPVCAEITL